MRGVRANQRLRIDPPFASDAYQSLVDTPILLRVTDGICVQGENTVDFVLVDKDVMIMVRYFDISDPSEFSDHKTLLFKLKC